MTVNNHASGGAKRPAGTLTFLAVAFIVFGATVMILASFDLVPNGMFDSMTEDLPSGSAPSDRTGKALPERIEIPKIELSASVANPTSTDADVLDKDLLYGAVRYPTSGTLGTEGQNVVLFGHSSYLPVVRNPAYKTFDGIQNLVKGDEILVTGGGTVYVYRVETVARANANAAAIPLSVTGNKLTLVTCDSFKTKSDRFVVIAKLVDSYPSSN
jgi:LPXTG-site transpeptidase (sortase) family protein